MAWLFIAQFLGEIPRNEQKVALRFVKAKCMRYRAEAMKRVAPARVGESPSNKDRVDAYLAEVWEKTGRKITRKDFWGAASYKAPTEFQRWQRDDLRTTSAARRNFERILREKPHLKILSSREMSKQ